MLTRIYATLILTFWFTPLCTQSLKIQKLKNTNTTRAVIVGISDYEDEGIPDLQFAHKDAIAFGDYLKSKAGGGVSEDNIKLYTNEEAKGGNIHKALYWLVKESKKDDKCIIYFSGHGDVETIYKDEPGHFLVHDSPSSIYQINSIRLDDLNRIISTLSTEIGAKVMVITDACRSGKLAGSKINGAQATVAALSKQYSNEIKVMSCQANEYSIEGEQWGGGRGMFSYHLIEGLIGLADEDNDLEVDLKEIQRYLEDRFDEDLVNATQTPLTVGDKKKNVSIVDPLILEELKLNKNIPSNTIAFAGNTQEKNVSSLEEGFYKAIKQKYFLENFKPELDGVTELSALEYFNQMSLDSRFSDKLPILKGDLIAALQNDAQSAINKYLQLDPEAFHSRRRGDPTQFDAFPIYLGKCAELLGEFHYLYPQVKAKELYFKVVSKRIKLDKKDSPSHNYLPLLGILEEALVYQKRSPFILNELAILKMRTLDYEEAIELLEEAKSISPSWAMPYNNISFVNTKLGNHDKSISEALKAHELNNKIDSPFHNLSRAYFLKGDIEKAIEYDKLILEKYPENCFAINNMGYKYASIKKEKEAEEIYNQALECNYNLIVAHINRSILKLENNRVKEAISDLTEAIGKVEEPDQIYDQLGYIYESQNQYSKAMKSYRKAIELNPNNISCNYYLAILLYNDLQFDEAIREFQFYIDKKGSKSYRAYYFIACSYANKNDLKNFKKSMENAIDLGFKNKTKMEESKIPSSIKSSIEYLEIIQKLD